MRDDLRALYTALRLSRSTFRRIRLNFAWALGYNIVAVPVAAGVLFVWWGYQLPPGVAAAMEASSTLLVVMSSVALYLWRPPRLPGHDAPHDAAPPRSEERTPLLRNVNADTE